MQRRIFSKLGRTEKTGAAVLALLISACLAACGGPSAEPVSEEEPEVTAEAEEEPQTEVEAEEAEPQVEDPQVEAEPEPEQEEATVDDVYHPDTEGPEI